AKGDHDPERVTDRGRRLSASDTMMERRETPGFGDFLRMCPEWTSGFVPGLELGIGNVVLEFSGFTSIFGIVLWDVRCCR
ncbi:MAG: hypothetical protein ACI87E_002064, partial [Mariniblastus sp.]